MADRPTDADQSSETIHLPARSLTRPLTCPLTRSLTHSLTHSKFRVGMIERGRSGRWRCICVGPDGWAGSGRWKNKPPRRTASLAEAEARRMTRCAALTRQARTDSRKSQRTSDICSLLRRPTDRQAGRAAYVTAATMHTETAELELLVVPSLPHSLTPSLPQTSEHRSAHTHTHAHTYNMYVLILLNTLSQRRCFRNNNKGSDDDDNNNDYKNNKVTSGSIGISNGPSDGPHPS
eukprot:GHVU01168237.1.p1 GENE.GHVU01168237.1~~GHVU01168237.1.p1  ORF type:complete len:255 (-),score=14.15 GHVU01168237.1:257-961(-)